MFKLVTHYLNKLKEKKKIIVVGFYSGDMNFFMLENLGTCFFIFV